MAPRKSLMGMMVLWASLILMGCASQKKAAAPIVITNSDSTRIETLYKEIVVRDTVFVSLPPQTAERTTRDSISHLENDYATSDARINPDGSLTHSLDTKPQPIPVPVDSKNTVQEKIIYRDRNVQVPTPYPVEVERELGQWQKFCIKGFWVMLAAIIGMACWIWRKPIFNFIRRFI